MTEDAHQPRHQDHFFDNPAFLAAIVGSTGDAVIGKTLDGTIVSWNAAAQRMYGYCAEEAIGRSIRMLAPPERAGEIDDILAKIRQGVSVVRLTSVRRRADGKLMRVELTISPIHDRHGQIIGAASIARDLSDALAAAEMKSQFVAMVSHEIRTPMNGVMGLSRALLGTPLDPAQRRYAEAIQTSGRALLTVINDILDFSKMDAGKAQLVLVDYHLGELLETVVEVAAQASREKDLEIGCWYPPELDTVVRGDDGRLRQTLLNLVGNAVKFTDRGEVTLRAVVEDPGPDGAHRVAFSVTDTGVGIAAADMSRLFEPFIQVDAKPDREFGGTGLGLAISRQLVALMGGELRVRSEPGVGSEFSFALPLEPVADQPRSPALPGRRVVIADGSPSHRDLLAEHARAWGLLCSTSPACDDLLDDLREAAARGRPYDAAIVDEHLLDRAETASAVAAAVAAAGTRLVLVMTTSRDQHAELAAGAAAVLGKPVGPLRLRECLVRVLGSGDDRPARDDTGPEPVERPVAGQRTVLLAEDNRINQLVAIDLLEELGYGFDVAENGAEVLRLAGTKHYDAILMDCQMPRMDGYAASAALRRSEPGDQHVPIIAMTAGALAGDRERCLAAGMDDYLTKPIDEGDLRRALQRWSGAGETSADSLPQPARSKSPGRQ